MLIKVCCISISPYDPENIVQKLRKRSKNHMGTHTTENKI